MDTTYMTLWVDPTHRVQVHYQDSPECPRGDWDMATGALPVRRSRDTIEVVPVHEYPGSLTYAHDRFMDQGFSEVITARWSRIFYDIELDYLDGTYWWVDRTVFDTWKPVGTYDGVPLYTLDAAGKLATKRELERKIIGDEQHTYQQWANGYVYGLVIEEFKLMVAAGFDENGTLTVGPIDAEDFDDLDEYWTEGESVWGFYLDDDR